MFLIQGRSSRAPVDLEVQALQQIVNILEQMERADLIQNDPVRWFNNLK